MPQTSSFSEQREPDWQPPGLFAPSEAQGGSSSQVEADERLAQLARAIEIEIIPRLMLAHRAANECADYRAQLPMEIGPPEVLEFTRLVLAPVEEAAFAWVQSLRDNGVGIEAIYVDLLAPTARHLGELWTEDLCDFTEMTVALGRLQRLLRELSPAFHDLEDSPPIGRRILLMPCPGDQHTFGLVMVSEFFRRSGWEVAGGAWELGFDAQNMVATDWYDVVGFSVGAQTHIETLNHCIRGVRETSRNPAIVIMAGGPVFAVQSEMMTMVDADVVVTDGKQAPDMAEAVLSRRGSLAT